MQNTTTAPAAADVHTAKRLSPAQEKDLLALQEDGGRSWHRVHAGTRQALSMRRLADRNGLTETGERVAAVAEARVLLRSLRRAERSGRTLNAALQDKVAELQVRAGE
jgi:hypothetical protein